MCYVSPARGRCGAGGGPDPIAHWNQQFTQECLNHDRCCEVTGDRSFCITLPDGTQYCADVCGAPFTSECVVEFEAAIPSFFLAPDCGTTAGTWKADVPGPDPLSLNGFTWTITGGDSSARDGGQTTFKGTVDMFTAYEGCGGTIGKWPVTGTRDGQSVQFTATNPYPASIILYVRPRLPLVGLLPTATKQVALGPIPMETRARGPGNAPISLDKAISPVSNAPPAL